MANNTNEWLAIVIRPGMPPLELEGPAPAALLSSVADHIGNLDAAWIISFQHVGARREPADTPASPVNTLG